jgi:hypothetical protein
MAKTTTAPAAAAVKIRVRYVYDEDARFEECNGEARPLTEAEYAENSYRSCPDHPRAGTIVVNEEPPYTSAQIQGCAVCRRTDYVDVPYAEYLRYYGDPDRHVYLGCVAEACCACCGSWTVKGSVWGIDLMDDSPELRAITVGEWMTEAAAAALPGYAGDMAREQIAEARDA